MKYIISLLMTLTSIAAPIEITYVENAEIAEIIKENLTQIYLIPENLIELYKVKDCIKKGHAKLEICTQKSGETVVLSANKEFIKKSLSVFRN